MRVVKRVQCRTLMSCVISRVVALQSGAMSKFCLRIVLFISLSSKTSAFFCPRPVALLARAHCRITDNSHKYPCRTRCIRGAATCRLRAAPTSARTSMGRLGCNIESRVILPAPRRRYIVDNLVWEERSKTTLFAVGADGTGGRNEDRVEVQKNDSDGWRQRVVRTIMTTLSRVRNFLTALSARLGFSRRKGSVTTSLFRARGDDASRKRPSGSPGGSDILARIPRRTRVLVASMVAFLLCWSLSVAKTPSTTEVPMSKFMEVIESKSRSSVQDLRVLRNGKMTYLLDGKMSYTQPVMLQNFVREALAKGGVPYTAARTPGGAGLASMVLPLAYLVFLYFSVKRGAGEMVGSTGKLASSSDIDRSLTFDDVAGVDGPKSEVQELVSMLQDPEPYVAAGARLPSGLLMVGPPGTGKTLMARVMASEAGVPFYYCSGSDFVEMFVGRGAARVRKLFEKAAKTAPCIVFFDELDALGKERSGSGGGRQIRQRAGLRQKDNSTAKWMTSTADPVHHLKSNDEAEQTLNQLLASMDGLDTNNNGVLVIAATNRFDVLDNALTRPGRFDRVVRVGVPDVDGRAAILRVHTRKMKLEDPTVLSSVAEITPGLTGAELATIANEAAIAAARRKSRIVLAEDFQGAVQNFFVSRGMDKGVSALQNMIKGMLN